MSHLGYLDVPSFLEKINCSHMLHSNMKVCHSQLASCQALKLLKSAFKIIKDQNDLFQKSTFIVLITIVLAASSTPDGSGSLSYTPSVFANVDFYSTIFDHFSYLKM